MDRRQLLFGMTAAGLAGQLNLNELLRAQNIETNSHGSGQQSQLTARGQAGLHGPVKMCVEESASDYGKSASTTEYGLDGQLLTSRHEMDGKFSYSSSSSDWVQTEIHDSKGRLAKSIWGKRDEPVSETLYTYDEAGRLLTFTNSGQNRFEFHYGADGSKTSVQTFDPKAIEQTRDGAFAGSAWEGAQSGFGVPMGGNVTMIYDSHDHPTEMQVHSGDGKLVTRIARTYDAEGRITEERTLEQNMAFLVLDRMPPEQRAQLSPEQIQGMSESLNELGKLPAGTTFTYDAHGRINQKSERNMLFERTTTTLYNEQGDKARERETFKNNSTIPIGVPQSFDEKGNLIPTVAPERPEGFHLPPDSDTRYAYRYDSYGNWTERIETRSDGFSVTTRRDLTYY